MVLIFHSSVTKGLKLKKVRKFGRLIPTFSKVRKGKLAGEPLIPSMLENLA